jgi:hypothetical protein
MTSAGLDAAPVARVEWHWCIGLSLLYLLSVLKFFDISVLLILPVSVLNVLFAIIACTMELWSGLAIGAALDCHG